MKDLKFIIDKEQGRVDKVIVELTPDLSRSDVKRLFDNGLIDVNLKKVKPSYLVKPGDVIEVRIPEPEIWDVKGEDIPLDVVYEDEDVIVVNKPALMVVHPAPGHYSGTLVNALMHHCKDLSSIKGIIRAGIVHRIDKDTSGLLVACKNDAAHRDISAQFKAKKIKRTYVAIVCGVINHNLGKIDAPIGRSPINRQQMGVVGDGKPSVTHFKVIERFKEHTLVELNLETGRTHQIRVHMKYIGYPLLGDPVYGSPKNVSEYGQFLHAQTLGFIHPRTKEYLEFTSELPDYFEEKINELRAEMK
jgi:23S rRNA pseudouridine1911/1915/1917 synthase